MNTQGKITTTMTSREFNQHTGAAKSAADNGPVVITDRGRPAYVLLSQSDYERLTGKQKPKTALETLADPSPDGDFPYEFERLDWQLRDIDFGKP